jgi:hypothetical protein
MGERPRTEIIVADTQELVQQSLKIRFDGASTYPSCMQLAHDRPTKVFVHEQKFPEDTELDEYAESIIHGHV